MACRPLRVSLDHRTIIFACQNVVTLNELGLSDAEDSRVILEATLQKRVLVTRDKDFSDIRVYPPELYRRIVVLRMKANDEQLVHSVLTNFINEYITKNLQGKLVIISKDKIRIR